MKSNRQHDVKAHGGPAPQGAGGLKWEYPHLGFMYCGPAPQGAGGLKWKFCSTRALRPWSRPARGGWIEMDLTDLPNQLTMVPPRKGRVD